MIDFEKDLVLALLSVRRPSRRLFVIKRQKTIFSNFPGRRGNAHDHQRTMRRHQSYGSRDSNTMVKLLFTMLHLKQLMPTWLHLTYRMLFGHVGGSSEKNLSTSNGFFSPCMIPICTILITECANRACLETCLVKMLAIEAKALKYLLIVSCLVRQMDM